MRSYAITIKGDKISETGVERLQQSSTNLGNEFDIETFDAVTPKNVYEVMKNENVHWNWPQVGSIHDKETGIRKIGYGGKCPEKRMACGMSHYLLWKKAIMDGPILVLEHDALFINKIEPEYIINSEYLAIGINDPRGATRLSNKFHDIIQKSKKEILPTPEIDRNEIAQGLAGHSAYIIKPKAAEILMKLVEKYGMWNNDAIMCRQLMPNMLGVTKKYYTKTQGFRSTTMN